MRKHLSADALIGAIRERFETITDPRNGKPQICLPDALMSAFAMFSLKDPSLRAIPGPPQKPQRAYHPSIAFGKL